MALQQDERALLQLICERGQGYDDLAELIGVNEDEVRAKARTALTKLGGADPDAEVSLTDYLLGQADPIGRADAVRFLQQDDEARDLAGVIVTKLEALAPAAELPSIPEPKGRRRRAAAPTPSEAAATERASREPRAGSVARPRQDAARTRLIAGIVGGGVILLFVILAVAGVFSSDEGGDGSAEALAAGEQGEIAPVTLSPRGGSGVGGQADFALADSTLFVNLAVDGLDPSPGRDKAYLLWLMISGEAGFPLPTPLVPDENGTFADRIPIAAELIGVAGAAQSIQISETSTKSLSDAVATAADQGSPVLPFDGKVLAAGQIPVAEGAQAGAGAGAGGGSGSGNGNGGGSSGGGDAAGAGSGAASP